MVDVYKGRIIASPFELVEPDRFALSQIGGKSLETVIDAGAKAHGLLNFAEFGVVPTELSEWMSYLTTSDPMMLSSAPDDAMRFKDSDEISERFLKDRGGRNLTVAVSGSDNEGYSLSGVSWFHPLIGDYFDHDLYSAVEQHEFEEEGVGFGGEPELRKRSLSPARVGTNALRAYGEPCRRKGLGKLLLIKSLEEYYSQHPACDGIAVRLAQNAAGITVYESMSSIDPALRFKHIESGEGAHVLLNRRPVEANQ